MNLEMNLEKRIKRHFSARLHDCLAVTLPGFELVCRKELETLAGTIAVMGKINGGIQFRAKFIDIQRANLHLRSAVRILVRLHQAGTTNFNRLEKQIDRIPWHLYLPMGWVPDIKVTSHRSRLFHSSAVAERIRQRIGRHWRNLGAEPQPGDHQTLYVRLHRDDLLISLDSSGNALYQRGLKSHPARAPLRETTAAAILLLCGFRPESCLVDPMCGAGTFALEGAMIAKDMAPGRHRRFAFMQWPAFRSRQWDHLVKTAEQAVKTAQTETILASDQDPRACRHLAEAAARWGLQDALRVRCRDFFSEAPPVSPVPPGLVVLNPPYGRRLGTPGTLEEFYRRIGTHLWARFKGWRLAMIVPDPALARQLPFKLSSKRFRHGGLDVVLLHGEIKID